MVSREKERMAAIDVGDVLEAVIKGKFLSTDDIVSVFQTKITDEQGGTAAEGLIFIDEWFTALVTSLVAEFSNAYSVPEILVTNLTQDSFIGQLTPAFAGTNVADATSPQICALVMARTGVTSVQGRKYLGVFTEEDVDGGTWSTGLIDNLVTAADVWQDLFLASNSVEGEGQVVTKDATGAMTDHRNITGTRVICDTRTQRRRTLGRGS